MKFIIAITALLCLVSVSPVNAQAPAAGKQVAASTAVKVASDAGQQDATLRYLLYLPAEYDKAKDTSWPLVLFLHGSGERGDDIERVKIHGPPKLVAGGKQFPFVLCS